MAKKGKAKEKDVCDMVSYCVRKCDIRMDEPEELKHNKQEWKEFHRCQGKLNFFLSVQYH